jgi:hypothetical protein
MLSFGEVFSEAAASIWKLFERGNGIARAIALKSRLPEGWFKAESASAKSASRSKSRCGSRWGISLAVRFILSRARNGASSFEPSSF